MPIQVTCPGCLKRFTVSDKYAGRTGPCPKCQKPIKIPELTDEVVIHAPKDISPKDAAGRSIFKPIRRRDVSISAPVLIGAVLSVVVVFGLAFAVSLSGSQPPTALLAASSIVLAIPLVYVGYWFLHDDELEGFTGQQLLIRIAVVAIGFAALWGLYAFVPSYVAGYSAMAEFSAMDMFLAVTGMIIAGTLIAVAALELEVAQGVMLYMLYFSLTFVLAWLAGTQLGGPLSGDYFTGTESPPAVAPGPHDPDTAQPSTESGQKVPDLLQ